MRYFRMRQKVFYRRHNFRNAGFVVRAQQSTAVCVDYRFALLIRQPRFLRRIQFQSSCKRYFSSVIFLYQLGLNVFSGNIACRVQMGKETYSGSRFSAFACRNPRCHITVRAKFYFIYAKPQKLVLQRPRQIPLPQA